MSSPIITSSQRAAPGGNSYLEDEVITCLMNLRLIKLLPDEAAVKNGFTLTKCLTRQYLSRLPMFRSRFPCGIFSDGSSEELPLTRVGTKALEFIGFTSTAAEVIWARFLQDHSAMKKIFSRNPHSPLHFLNFVVTYLGSFQDLLAVGVSQDRAAKLIGLQPGFLPDLFSHYADGAGFRPQVLCKLVTHMVTHKYQQLTEWHFALHKLANELLVKKKKQLLWLPKLSMQKQKQRRRQQQQQYPMQQQHPSRPRISPLAAPEVSSHKGWSFLESLPLPM
ncbi:hypothetical protein POX_d05488 [Penicillium oxalicum]|uniref:Uncharacterized protein n=1 Tax=Penicillium oxalicum (strain 114-2 / CGMCC 5302) TaxID=933388 RepID=S7ZNW7_PENO1|nr:hypothetical protein POX_d05488 [Penicillium oxalicum]EPS32350.1 hypothetical protein PDE_07310 [Penicillium oxalicum 114-2]KAI2789987.1 hypothetical protein POX_d05488 [Penicillium oxalicum]